MNYSTGRDLKYRLLAAIAKCYTANGGASRRRRRKGKQKGGPRVEKAARQIQKEPEAYRDKQSGEGSRRQKRNNQRGGQEGVPTVTDPEQVHQKPNRPVGPNRASQSGA